MEGRQIREISPLRAHVLRETCTRYGSLLFTARTHPPPLLVGRSVVMARLCSFVHNNGCKFEQDKPMVVGLKLSSSARLYPVMAVELHL